LAKYKGSPWLLRQSAKRYRGQTWRESKSSGHSQKIRLNWQVVASSYSYRFYCLEPLESSSTVSLKIPLDGRSGKSRRRSSAYQLSTASLKSPIAPCSAAGSFAIRSSTEVQRTGIKISTISVFAFFSRANLCTSVTYLKTRYNPFLSLCIEFFYLDDDV
jgi:hypothetical protein